MNDVYPLSFGQIAVIRDYLHARPEHAWVATLIASWDVPAGATEDQVREALITVANRHDSLRTEYRDLDSARPVQRVAPHRRDFELTTVADDDATAPPEALTYPGSPEVQAFDLEAGRTWRATIVTGSAGPTEVRAEFHRVAADVVGCEVLYREFRMILDGADLPPACQPGQLAVEQRSETWRRRNENAAKYFASTYRQAATISGYPQAEGLPPTTGSLRSARSLAASRSLAERLGVPVTTVLLAAAAEAVGTELNELPPIMLMVSNRHVSGYEDLVSSLTQWVPMVMEHRPQESFAASVLRLQGHMLRAFRNSCFDPDAALNEIRSVQTETGVKLSRSLSFNYVPGPPLDPTVRLPDDADIRWRDDDKLASPRLFVQATEQGGFALTVVAAWEGLDRPGVERILHHVRDRLDQGTDGAEEGSATC